jgi:hypothetical protein
MRVNVMRWVGSFETEIRALDFFRQVSRARGADASARVPGASSVAMLQATSLPVSRSRTPVSSLDSGLSHPASEEESIDPESSAARGSDKPVASAGASHAESFTVEGPPGVSRVGDQASALSKPSQSLGGAVRGIACPPSEVSCANQYEAVIRPDGHSITNDELLSRTPYIVNTKHMALICIHCKHSVNPNSASDHVKQKHRYCKLPRTFTTELNAKYPGLATEMIHPLEIIRPIFGLAIPVEQYVVCARCLRGYVSILSWRSHSCEKAEIDLNGAPPHFPSLVQTFFRGPKLCYFPVETPAKSTADTIINDFELFKSQFPHIETAGDEVIDAPDYRELDQFLLKEGWLAHVAKFSRAELSKLTHLPQQDEDLAPITHEVLLLMSRIQSIIGSAGIYVRRLLGRRPS